LAGAGSVAVAVREPIVCADWGVGGRGLGAGRGDMPSSLKMAESGSAADRGLTDAEVDMLQYFIMKSSAR